MDISTMLAFGVPGTVTGIGFVLAFNTAPWYLTGTAAIIVFAMMVRNVQVAIEAGVNSLRQVDPAIEEASAVLGANSTKTFVRIALPLLRHAVFTGLVYSFVRSMTSISAITFLISVNWNVLTTTVLSQVEQGRLGVAAAYCTVLIAIVLVAMGGFQLIANSSVRKNSR